MFDFVCVVLEEEADFTKYIEVSIDIHNSGVMIDTAMKFCSQSF